MSLLSNQTIPPHASFAAERRYDRHTGIDLYGGANPRTEAIEVSALEDGVVVAIDLFTGANAGSPWWNDTWYVGVLGKSGYVVYGELSKPQLQVFAKLRRGEFIGTTSPVLKQYKGVSPVEMLHIELYSGFVEEPVTWLPLQDKPDFLLNPTSFVVKSMYEYDLISAYYSGKSAKRSRQPYMKHVDDGLEILNNRYASQLTMLSYCLHPLLQMDSDMGSCRNYIDFKLVNAEALMLATEYRSVANEYLSYRQIESIEEIRLSPIAEVNEMLVADKVQNYRDFRSYHYGRHPRSSELQEYFENWFKRLGVDPYGKTTN